MQRSPYATAPRHRQRPRLQVQVWVVCIVAVVALAIGLYHVKYKVVALERAYFALQRHEKHLRETARTLEAEYALLSSPKRLVRLAERHMGQAYANPAYHQHVSPVKLASTMEVVSGPPSSYAPEALLGDEEGWSPGHV